MSRRVPTVNIHTMDSRHTRTTPRPKTVIASYCSMNIYSRVWDCFILLWNIYRYINIHRHSAKWLWLYYAKCIVTSVMRMNMKYLLSFFVCRMHVCVLIILVFLVNNDLIRHSYNWLIFFLKSTNLRISYNRNS